MDDSSELISKKKKIVELNNRQVDELVDFANIGKKDVFYDLGCGTGRVVFSALSRNAKKSIGIEIDKKYYDIARKNAIEKFPKSVLKNKLDFWYGDFTSYKKGYGYVYDISDGTVIFNSLAPKEGTTIFYDTQFLNKKNVKIIKKDLPIVGYAPVEVNRKDKNAPFFLMETPLNKNRITSKRKWAQEILGNDAQISDVYDYYKSLWQKNNEIKDPALVLKELKKLVAKFLPDN